MKRDIANLVLKTFSEEEQDSSQLSAFCPLATGEHEWLPDGKRHRAKISVSAQEPRTLNEVRSVIDEGSEEPRNLLGGVFVVARHHHSDIEPVLTA